MVEHCEVSGNKSELTPCSKASDCAPGHVCGGFLCRKACHESSDCPDALTECKDVVDADELVVTGFGRCTRQCNPLAPSASDATHVGCPLGQSCWPSATGATDCVVSGSVGLGGNCTNANCQSPLLCYGTPGAYFCRQQCRMKGATCPTGQRCWPWGGGVSVYDGSDEIGYCN
jgi:hypothetical protein